MNKKKASVVALKVLRIFSWIVLSILGLLILIVVSVQIPWVQNKIKNKAISFLQEKIGTPVHLDRFVLSFPKKIVITGFYMEDQQKDTLLYAGRLGIDTDLWALTDNVIDLKKIELENFKSTIKRSEKDSAFNFDYIIQAFASPDTVVADTTAAAWDFKIGDVDLRNLRLSLSDSLSGNHVEASVGEFDLNMELFDLNNSIVSIDDVTLADVNAKVVQTKEPVAVPDTTEIVPEDSSAVAFSVDFNTINVKNILADYHQVALGQMVNMSIPSGSVEANAIDIKNQVIDLAGIVLQRPFISYQQMVVGKKPPVTVDPVTQQHDAAQPPWTFKLAALDIAGSSLQYHNYEQPSLPKGMDFNHLWVTDLNTRIRNIHYDGEEGNVSVTAFRFREKSGFRVRNFRTAVALKKDSFALRNFLLETGHSRLAMEASASFKSIQEVTETPENVLMRLAVNSSTLSLRDALYFNPHVLDSLPVSLTPESIVRLDAGLNGTLRDLIINRLQLHALENTSLFANGRLQNITDPAKLYYEISLDRFYTTKQDVMTLLPDTLIPAAIEMPQWVSLRGDYKGTINTPDIDTYLSSNLGAAQLIARLDMSREKKEKYRGEVRIIDFNVGKLLKQEQQMGSLDMVADVNGTGFAIETLDALLRVRVNKMQYSGYTYRDFRLDGSLKKYFFSGKASLKDENLDFVLSGDLDYNGDVPSYALDLDLRNADFKKLKLTPRPLKAKGEIVVDLTTADFKHINGDLGIRDFAVYNGDALYAVDSLLFASIDQEGQSEISIRSDILSGDFKGTINLFSLGDALGRHFNQYFSLRDTVYAKPLENQNFKFDLVLKNTELITEVLVPELEPFVPGEISGEFNSAENKLKMNLRLAEITYSGISLDSMVFLVDSNNESLDFNFGLTDIRMDTMKIHGLKVAGYVMNDSIHTNLMILDSLDQEKYFLGGVFNSFKDAFQFSLVKSHLVLNYEKWDTPLYNTLRFGEAGLEPNNFFIRKGEERILLLKKNNQDSTLSIDFNQVNLSNLTSIIEGTTPVSGRIDGDLTLSSARQGSFNTDLRVFELALFEQVWGDLSLLVDKSRTGPMNFKMGIQGEHARMHADGFLTSEEEPRISVNAVLEKLDLQIVEPLTMGQLKNLKGSVSGDFTVEGKSADPDLSGGISFHNASFLSTFANSTFAINDESIYLRDEDLVFDSFEILDDKKNKAVIDGLISSREEGGFALKLNLNATNFQLLNTKEGDNEMFYGNIRLNTSTTITGTSALPIIRMNISLAENSALTYIVPQSEKGILEQKGIVVFVDKDAKGDPFMAAIDPSDTIQSKFTGMDLTANIELSDTEQFNVVIDPVTGDKLSVRGNSTLTLHMDPTGDMQLSGRYEITQGSYDLSFAKFVKRNFVIDKGSTITWSGDPMNGEMDIRAIYEVETSPVELVANQVEESELDMYKKEVPFQVFLILKGELLFPEISFELDMPEDERDEYNGNVYAKLKDVNTRESDLNKQVFALLILKRFISDNPFENQAGGDLASSARKSVSKILSEQLNRLSSNVKGVELSFDLKSYDDYSSGSASGQTELQLGVSKTLLNDRLVVKVSGNVDLEGETSQQNSFTDFIGDLALEYKLTEDGRFRITGFRNSNYDMINGDLIETGAGLIYIKDYDSLRELFEANTKRGSEVKSMVK